MKSSTFRYLVLVFVLVLPYWLSAQMHVAVISPCGGIDSVVIPNITDRDSDGMDDRLETLLLAQFMPPVMMFSNENCPGPALNGTGDTNLIATRITPYPQQYTWSNSPDSVQVHPVALVGPRQLVPGMYWHTHFIMVHCAVLYGQDCGLLGHSADVEGFHFSLVYTGPDSVAGWMYDTIMNRWVGATIQSVGHDATTCQYIETLPYKSYLNPAGSDTVYASPDKHANYITVQGCDNNFICNPNCNSTQIRKNTVNVNVGEPNAPLVTDLGTYYAAYAGWSPWSTVNFLNGGAGTIPEKMERPLTTDFVHSTELTAAMICPLYTYCYGPDVHAYSDNTCSNEQYVFNGRRLSQSGVYTDTLSNVNGCDSVVTLSLTVYPYDTVPQAAFLCSGHTYDFNGMMLSAPGLYRDTLTGVHGCDSTLVLSLSLHYPSTYSYAAHICEGNTYSLNGQVLSAAGEYIDTITNAAGCDSVITLALAIDTPVAVHWPATVDTVWAHSNDLLLTATPAGGTYSGTGVSGNIFYPDSATGGPNLISYTYQDQYGCISTATRTYYLLYPEGVSGIALANAISLYPNPANDLLTAQSDLFSSNDSRPIVVDIAGQSIPVPADVDNNRIILHTGSLSAGMYMVKFTISGSVVTKKFIKAD
jgi:hypothetical protein